MINERGSITMVGMFLALSLMALFLTTTLLQLESMDRNRDHLELFLCTKKISGVTRTYVSRIEKINLLIALANLAIAYPPTSKAALQVKKALQYSQLALRGFFLFDLAKTVSPRCVFTPSLNYLPYKNNKFKFKRSLLGLTQLKKKKWKTHLWNSSLKLSLQYEIGALDFTPKTSSESTYIPLRRIKHRLQGLL